MSGIVAAQLVTNAKWWDWSRHDVINDPAVCFGEIPFAGSVMKTDCVNGELICADRRSDYDVSLRVDMSIRAGASSQKRRDAT